MASNKEGSQTSIPPQPERTVPETSRDENAQRASRHASHPVPEPVFGDEALFPSPLEPTVYDDYLLFPPSPTSPELQLIPPGTVSNNAMSSKHKGKEGQSSGTFHQEYIASMRYRNDLPPPEMPPKLLDIPHAGLERMITPGFASNLARREEPNIDVDAEGGMPIDLVGLPGLHLGDDSAIMFPEVPQQIDPADLPLLTTLEQLRNPAPKDTNVSFLRRTQHISVDRTAAAATKETPIKVQAKAAKKSKVSVDDPNHVKKYIQKGFDIAYPESKHDGEDTASRIRGLPATKAELDAWAHPVHPDNPNLKPVGFFPLLPDRTGFPDPGGFLQFKFDKPPVSEVDGKRDPRMDVALLVPSAPEERICQEHASKAALHKSNPSLHPDPGPIPWDYELYLPEKHEDVKNIETSMSLNDPNRDKADLYTHEGPDGKKYHRFDRVRTYATSAQTLNTDSKVRDIAVTLYKPGEGDTRQQAAYYYPILGKTRLKPERARTIAQAGLAPASQAQQDEDKVDQLQVIVRDPDEAEAYKRALHRANIDPKFAAKLPPPPEPPVEEQASPEVEQLPESEAPEKGASQDVADGDARMSDE